MKAIRKNHLLYPILAVARAIAAVFANRWIALPEN